MRGCKCDYTSPYLGFNHTCPISNRTSDYPSEGLGFRVPSTSSEASDTDVGDAAP